MRVADNGERRKLLKLLALLAKAILYTVLARMHTEIKVINYSGKF